MIDPQLEQIHQRKLADAVARTERDLDAEAQRGASSERAEERISDRGSPGERGRA